MGYFTIKYRNQKNLSLLSVMVLISILRALRRPAIIVLVVATIQKVKQTPWQGLTTLYEMSLTEHVSKLETSATSALTRPSIYQCPSSSDALNV
jgi:hypothetical protein